MKETVIATIHSTGISIVYTCLVLIAGLIIFSFSSFWATQSLEWFTWLTLITATITNLVLLPALLITMSKEKKGKVKSVQQKITIVCLVFNIFIYNDLIRVF